MQNQIIYGLMLSLIAGLATAIGSTIAFLTKTPPYRILSPILGFSAGVMISVSFFEIFPKSVDNIGFPISILFFFLGIIIFLITDFIVPHAYIAEKFKCENTRLMKVGLFTALGIAIHNLPEGLTVFASTLYSIRTGVLVAIAIAFHNIPEGISVSVPIYCATKNKKTAFKYSVLSGISEPFAAILGAIFLFKFLSPFVIGAMLALVAGIMVYISFDELLPSAHKYGEEHLATSGLFIGMLIMAITLVILK